MNQKRYRRKLLRKRKRNTLLLVLILISIFVLPVKPAILKAHTPVEYIAVIVEDGDSLWKIAERYIDEQRDIRQYISVILEHNQKRSAEIYPGEVLKIPLYFDK